MVWCRGFCRRSAPSLTTSFPCGIDEEVDGEKLRKLGVRWYVILGSYNMYYLGP